MRKFTRSQKECSTEYVAVDIRFEMVSLGSANIVSTSVGGVRTYHLISRWLSSEPFSSSEVRRRAQTTGTSKWARYNHNNDSYFR